MTDLDRNRTSSPASTSVDVADFLTQIRSAGPPRGRLIFALDATASRQPTWETACHLQAEMFREAGAIGGLDVQLVYYRGEAECRASRWISQASQLTGLMEQIDCRGGHTQISKVLAHAKREAGHSKVQGLVFVGDAMEENPDTLCHAASELGHLGVPVFMFHEGDDPSVAQTFCEISRLTHGAYCRFDLGAARQLAELLRAVAVYAVGGLTALAARDDAGAVKLLGQLK